MKLLEGADDGRAVVGMVHLPPLPGAPAYDGDRERIRSRTIADATALEAGGVDAVVVENFGDTPYYPESVPKATVAELTAVTVAVEAAVDVPLGVNVLRNDADAALSVAAATGGSFVRVNVHTGTAATDQGILDGRAHETVRLRDRIDASVAILADVHVKHAMPIGDASLERVAVETVERGLADGVFVSGPGTGEETSLEHVERVVDAVGESVPVFVGSGVTADTIGNCYEAGADGVVVGTALKEEGETTNPVSRERVEAVVEAGRDRGEGPDANES